MTDGQVERMGGDGKVDGRTLVGSEGRKRRSQGQDR